MNLYICIQSNTNMSHLGLRIQLARIEKGMNQDDLSHAIGKSKALISHIERTGKVKYSTLKLISKALGISIEKLNSQPESEANSQASNIEMLNLTIESLRKENELLKELLENQKRIISLMDTNKK